MRRSKIAQEIFEITGDNILINNFHNNGSHKRERDIVILVSTVSFPASRKIPGYIPVNKRKLYDTKLIYKTFPLRQPQYRNSED